jgi:hypothetical protein
VADLAGQDKLSLVGVQFVPAPLTGQTVANWNTATNTTANTSETHTLTITISNAFDSATANTTNAGNYAWAIRAGGEFRAGPTAAGACAGAACNTIGNSVTFPGTGTFSPTLVNTKILSPAGSPTNTSPLSFTVAGPTNPIVSFNGLSNATLGQVNPTYPTFVCDNNGSTAGGACKPSITEVMTVTLKGPDSFVLVNGGDGFGASCAATLTATQQKQIALLTKIVAFLNLWESTHPNPLLSAFIDKIEAFLATVNTVDPNCGGATLINLDIATAAAIDQVAFVADGAVPAEPAPQTGTITIVKNTDLVTSSTFTFNISIGEDESVITSIPMGSANTGTTTVTVNAGTYSIIESVPGGWSFGSASCVETGDGISNGVVGVVVPAGGNVTCTFNNNKTFNPDDYRVISSPNVTWDAARTAAQALGQTLGGVWDLATITSAAEQATINSLLPNPTSLTGTNQYWIGGEQVGEVEPGGNWQWINGEGEFWNSSQTDGQNGAIPGKYQNWGNNTNGPGVGLQPDNGGTPPRQNHLSLDNRYGWGWDDNDFDLYAILGYVAERVSP